jgi:hypothetical protein
MLGAWPPGLANTVSILPLSSSRTNWPRKWVRWPLIAGRGLAMLGWGISAIIVVLNIQLAAVAVLQWL